MWRKATLTERLVGDVNIQMKKKTLKTAVSITIATWLDEIHELRRRMQRGKTASLVMSMTAPETLRKADKQFKRKINAAKHDIKDGQTGSWGTSCGHVNRGTS